MTDDLAFGLGGIQSPPDDRDYTIDALYAATGKTPTRTFASRFVVPGQPPILDQRTTPQCTVHAVARQLQWEETKAGLPIAFFGSVGVAAVLYVLIVIVTTGSLSPAELAAAQSNVLTAAGKAVMGPPGAVLLAVGAILATASAINADYFGASKLPVVLAEQDEAPAVADREVWGRHPVGLLVIMVLALVCAAFLNLHALSAAASAGFIAVFAVVNLANARMADRTGSRRWISIVGTLACVVALAALVLDLLRQPGHGAEVGVIAALLILPFVYQVLYQRLAVARRTAARS